MLRALGVIPARFESTRFRGKPLAPLGDRTLLGTVWERASRARRLDAVIVATDDDRIAEHARSIGAEVRMTSSEHPSGTDRVAEVVRSWPGPLDVVVNLQGDEPLVTPTALDLLVDAFLTDDAPDIATLAEPIGSIEEFLDPDVVKVVTDDAGGALYFSRSPIPFVRPDGSDRDLRSALSRNPGALQMLRKHQGVYAYRRSVLERLTAMAPSPLERLERLEQLRALQAGFGIRVLPSDFRSIGVDTPEDLERVRALLERGPAGTTEDCRK